MALRAKKGKDGLTPQQRAFANEYAQTGAAGYSAAKAGYAHPEVHGHNLLKQPAVAAAVTSKRQAAMLELAEEGVPLAVATLMEIAGNKAAKDSDRIAASKVILHATAQVQGASDKPLEDMTPGELSRYKQQLEARIAALDLEAATIDGDAVEIEPESDVFG